MQKNICYAGIDVAKNHLDVYVYPLNQEKRFDNNSSGIKALIIWLKKYQPTLTTLEATGAYELPILLSCYQEGISIARENPSRIRYFARALGYLAKTDKVDAKVIAIYGEKINPRLYSPSDQEIEQIRLLVARRGHLINMINQEGNRRKMSQYKMLWHMLDEHLTSAL